MEYQALYRKYRPKTFSDVIGQEHIVKTLKNQIISGKISHAYLFCGTRGTGKTSTAKIFARAINCLNPKDGEPCMECAMCLADISGKSVNVIEIDAASNRGIDSVKELREDIKYAPAEGFYKVYIVDEIHMLTPEAFNALLKTLEEPPKHVIFILATTDPQKILATILSRCQRFDFKRITSEEISAAIKKYLELEGISADDDAVKYVALLGDGSMRDALSILDQCLAYFSGERVTLDKILEITGDVDISFYKSISDGIFARDTQKVLEILGRVMSAGRDINRFVSGYISYLRNLLVVSSVDNPQSILDISEDLLESLKSQSESTSVLNIMYMIERLSKLVSDLRYASNPYVLAEVEFIRFSAGIVLSESNTEALEIKVSQLEAMMKNGNFARKKPSVEEKKETENQPVQEERVLERVASFKDEDFYRVSEALSAIYPDLGNAFKSILSKTELKKGEEGEFLYVCKYKTHAEFINNGIKTIKDALADKFAMEINVKAILESEYKEKYEKTDESAEDMEEFQDMIKNRFSENAEDVEFLD